MVTKFTSSLFSKKRTKFLFVALLLIFSIIPVFAQLSGTKTIPGDYATISAAVTDLNTQGVGTGGVIFNVAAGYTESITIPIIITATGTLSNPIAFQKNGGGANPLVTRTDAGTITTSTIGGDGDAVFQLNGTDYITFNGIDIAASDQGIDYGYYTFKPSGTDGCQFVTFQNCVVTLTRGTNQYSVGIHISNGPASGSSSTGVTVSAASGMNANVTILGNTIQNVATGIYVRGSTAYYDSVITIGQSGAGNIIQNFGINTGSTNTEYGVYFIYVENPTVAYNTINNAGGGGAAHNGTFYCVFYSTVSGDVVGSNNAMTIANAATSSSTYYFYNTNTCNSETFTDNTFASTGTLPSGSLYFIYLSNGTPDKLISGNSTVGTIDKAGGGTYCYYNAGSPASGTETITNNTYSNINVASGSSTFYGFYSNTAAGQSRVMSGNTLSNINSSSTGSLYCLYAIASGNSQVYNNTANNIISGGSIYCMYAGGSNTVYNNNIYGITSTTTSTSAIYGAYSTTATEVTWYNNFLSDLKAPNGTSTTASVYGFYISSGTNVNLFYNTVYLDYTAVASANRSAALYVSSTPTAVDMRDNIFVNNCDISAGTLAMAFRKSSTSLTNLSSNTNNNLYYAGIPSSKNAIFFDGTNTDTTLSDYKARVSPIESASITENPPFVNKTTPPYDLHMNTGIATQTESGGTPVAAVTVDYDGDTRNATTPDIGADEFNGIPQDVTPPSIAYTPLINTSSTSARTLTTSITDASGVPTAGIGLPVLYWRINSGSWNPATATYLSGNDYQFTFGSGVALNDTVKYYICAQDNASPPNIGAAPSGGAGGFTANPPAASIPPTDPSSYLIVDLPLSGDYTVGTTLFSTITGRNITFIKSSKKVLKEVVVENQTSEIKDEKGIENEIPVNLLSPNLNGTKKMVEVEEVSWIPMENGKPYAGDLYIKKYDHPEINFPDGIDGIYLTITAAVADLNLRGVAGPVRFLLTDAAYSTGETFPIVINIVNESQPTATNTVTFQPNTGVTSTITSSTAQYVFAVNGCDYIIFDGSNSVGGTTRDLSIVNDNTVTANLGIVLFHSGLKGATNITVKNCIIKGSPTPSTSYGLFLNAAGGAFHNTSFINNVIKNFRIGIQFAGVAGSITNDGLISNNIVGDATEPLTVSGILVSQADNLTIIGNEIFGQIEGNTTTSKYGISLIAGSTNCKIQKNNIHDFYYTGTGGYGCFGIRYNSDATTVTEISNNLIHNIKGDGDASSLTYTPAGIYIISGGNVNLYYNSIYMSGATLGAGTTYNGRSACVSIAAGITLLDFRDNIFQNSMDSFPGSTRTNTTYGVYCSSANTAFTDINYNDYYVNGIGPFVGYLGGDQVNLAAWQTATGKDANSISADPLYQSTTDLQPAYNSPVIAAGTPIAGITTDYLGVTRSATNPSMGAYEEGVITPIPAGTYTVGLNDFLRKTGKKIYFEKRTRTVTKDLLADDSYIDLNANNDEKDRLSMKSGKNDIERYITVNEEYIEMMENGKPFDQSFFRKNTALGVYPTITSAITDLGLRGIAGPVTFLLVDSDYPSETYPLMLTDIVGASEVNTITFKPGPGIQANIPGSSSQTSPTFQLNGVDHLIIDGSNTNGGTTKDLHITNPASLAALHFYNSASHNILMNTILDSKYSGTASGTIVFGATASGDSNYVGNCTITKSDTSAVMQGVGIYFFSSNTSTFNKIVDCEISDFRYYGIRPQGAPSTNNLIKGNLIYLTIPSPSSVYGIYVSRQPGLVIEENYILNLQSSLASPSLIGIYYLGSSGNPVDIYVRNNVVSLSADYNQPAGTLRGIDYFAWAANSAEIYFNTIYIGGTDVTGGTTTGLSKRDAATLFKAYDNAVYNTRSNGSGTGKHYAVYFSNTTTPFEMNNNDYFADGTGGIFGYFGADVLTLGEWQTLTLQDANSISENPIFVSNLDYRPQDISPLLDAGITIAGITTDILGDLRGTPPTIGAYENPVFVPINAPTSLVAVADTFTVDLSWQDNSTNEFGFVIERKDGDSLSVNPFLPIDTVSVDVVNYLDTGLSANTTYTYRVYGYNSSGNSGYSNMAQATTFIPVEFTSFVAEISGRDVIVKWSTATETNNRGFDIERKLDGEWEKIGFKDGKGSTTEPSDYSFTDKFTYTSYKGMITYRLKQMDFDGSYAYSSEIEIDADFTPKEYTLYQNYPNPFNPVTTIKYSLPFESKVRIAVYNILGELVDVVVDELKEVGFHDYNWNASNLASGIYIYTIEAKSVSGDKSYSSVKKMVLMK